jgi:hypothetical protein
MGRADIPNHCTKHQQILFEIFKNFALVLCDHKGIQE